jgi:uracil-DNA glycosylase family 4
MEIPARKHPKAACEICPWREVGKYVPSQFPAGSARLAVVGEAPGAQEARSGIPFTGPSGELLESVLNYHGIERKDIALINTVSCRPYGPTEKPPKQVISACNERLEYDLEKAAAPKILAVGGTSAQVLLNTKTKITKLRIGWDRSSKYGPVISTWHPAFCLRTPDAFPSFVTDVGKLFNDPLSWRPPIYKVFNDPTTALVAINRLSSVDKVVIDIEAASDKDLDDSHPENYEILCVGVAYTKSQAVVFGDRVFKDEACIAAFAKLIEKVPVEAWNGKFDMLGLSPLFGVKKLSGDGMLRSYVLDERPRQHGLKDRAVEDLGAPRYDEEIQKYVKGKDGSYAKIPKPILYKYNAYDACSTWDLIEQQESKMSADNKKLHKFLIEAANELMHIELNGIYFDLEYNQHLHEVYEEKLDKSEAEIEAAIGKKLNPRSPIQIQRYFAEHGYTIPTTSKDFLKQIRLSLRDPVGPFVDLLLVNRRFGKLYGTYVKGLRRKVRDGKIYTTYSLHATTSGRLASRNPNLQNVDRDKDIRNQFVCLPGHVFVQGDYKQAEGRTIAHLSKDEYLLSLFRNTKVDIFNNLCMQIWGEGEWWNNQVLKKERRVSIKSVFYGLSYGREAKSIAHELGISLSESVELLRDFKELIPGVVAWQQSVKQQTLNEQELWTPFGRKRTFHLITNENLKDVLNEALSFQPQSIASDICLRAAIRLRPRLEGIALIRLLVHDSIVAECAEKDKEEVAKIMVEEMVRSAAEFTDLVPFTVDTTYATRLGEL